MRARWLAVCLLGACQTLPGGPTPPADFDPTALWQAVHRQDAPARAQLVEEAAWERTGSVEAERYRQSEWLRRGRRAELLYEAEQRLADAPFDPDLLYLQARLLQDPVRLGARFEQLAREHPRHAWIRLGAAGASLQLGEWSRAREHLQAAPVWRDAEDFRALIEARLADAQGAAKPWSGLLEAALLRGSPQALAEVRALAQARGDRAVLEAVDAERQLRAQGLKGGGLAPGSDEEADALEVLLRRLHAQLAVEPQLGWGETLARLDGWSEHLGLPVVWGSAPQLQLPLEAGLLLRPESDQGALSQLLARHRRVVLLGWSWLNGTQAVELQDVDRHQIAWPGSATGVEIVAARGARGQTGWVSGGAIFRGFFVRRDLTERAADALAATLGRMDLPASPQGEAWRTQLPAAARGLDVAEALPEDLDLAWRLRAREGGQLATQARAKAWRSLLVHEAGHLPDVLPWTAGDGGPLLATLRRALGSWLRDGWLLAEWEYRAHLRALEAAPDPAWILAELVETAMDPSQPYHGPYRRLLRDLIAVARRDGWPPLARWDERSDADYQALARQLAEEQGISCLDPEAVAALIAAVPADS